MKLIEQTIKVNLIGPVLCCINFVYLLNLPVNPINSSQGMIMASSGDVNYIKRKIEQIRWFHQIDLGNGLITPGISNCSRELQKINLPKDLSNKTVLDIGAWDGFFSFEAERRGAKRVLAVDSFCWSGNGWGNKSGFNLARDVLKSKVEDKEIEVLDLSPETVGQFDIVLFLGVLYHMKYPLIGLEKVSSVTKEVLILETVVDFVGIKRPVMGFYRNKELNNDPTNWWAPNPACLLEMLKTVGFKNIDIVSPPDVFPLRMAKSIYRKYRYKFPIFPSLQQSRMAVHAWK